MDPIVAASLISGGSNLLGGLTSAFGAKNQMSQKSAMRMQQNINQEQMKFGLVEGPAWEMAGLKKAGINPLLRYGQSGSPTGVSAQGVSQGTPINKLSGLAEGISNVGSSAADVYSKLTSARKTEQEIENLSQEYKSIITNRELTEAQIKTETQRMFNTFTDTLLKAAQTNLSEQDFLKVEASIKNINVDTANKELIGIMLQNGSDLSTIAKSFLVEGGTAAYNLMEWITQTNLKLRAATIDAPGAARDFNNYIGAGLREWLGLPAYNP